MFRWLFCCRLRCFWKRGELIRRIYIHLRVHQPTLGSVWWVVWLSDPQCLNAREFFLQPEKKTGLEWDCEISIIMNSVKKLITTFELYQCRNFILYRLVNSIVIQICSVNLKKFNYRIYTPGPHIAGLPAWYRFVSSSTAVAKLGPIETRSSIRHKLSPLIVCLYRASIYF